MLYRHAIKQKAYALFCELCPNCLLNRIIRMTNEQKTNVEKTTITTWYIFAHTNHTKNVEKQRTKWISNWRFLLHFRINYNPALGMIGYKWNMVHIRLLQLIASLSTPRCNGGHANAFHSNWLWHCRTVVIFHGGEMQLPLDLSPIQCSKS